ncbi:MULTISPECIES: 1-aminocyclopropane-1-carboxylate deaminase/D-cysteine desulfhydrase [Actinoalloteichus]|uniref:1-aminocyclopropane-1-carboxylate deaminase n=1 Tax=Actinoalloteichus fjordicus TaxID=1612552 RepID=A0AAC9LEZ7_9PSEU|nr:MULTISPECIES: pyridoxal-phosphate dependent enzyme [Actinoalloteichus]APU15014.1 1-aminocyclopropane-1-carboxylate deaminase [Actinoalloteichus fjordicus]APU21082.1 1-aminocyclopropane-1-carboxylate deaminase [Actinoalloteichus sp. GBA129-24]
MTEPAAPPRVALTTTPTRIQPLAGLCRRRIHLKRDDENSSIFGGCKTRALEFVLGAATQADATTVLTAGTVGSNHIAATALHAARLGLAVTALVLPQEPGPLVRRNLQLALNAGARLHPVPTGVSVHPSRPRHQAAVDELLDRGERPFVIPFGGAAPVAGIAHALAGRELADQARALALPTPLRVYLPAASTLTAAGIAAGLATGLATAEMPFEVTAVDVVGDPSVTGAGLLGRARETAALIGAEEHAVRPEHLRHVDGHSAAPYGRPDPRSEHAARLLHDTAGIAVDECYGAKALARLLADADTTDDGTYLFWHTGNTRSADGGVSTPVPPELAHYAR